MKDLMKVLEFYLEKTSDAPKEFECVYEERMTLSQIAEMINILKKINSFTGK